MIFLWNTKQILSIQKLVSKYFLILFINKINFKNSYRKEKAYMFPKLIINIDKINEYSTKNEIKALNKKITELVKKIKKMEVEVIIIFNKIRLIIYY